jgi:hypothetical protein
MGRFELWEKGRDFAIPSLLTDQPSLADGDLLRLRHSD